MSARRRCCASPPSTSARRPSSPATSPRSPPTPTTTSGLGQRYYKADIEIDDGELDKLDHVTLMPGMPVESFIRTGDRSALSYFVKPMDDYFTRAFRDG